MERHRKGAARKKIRKALRLYASKHESLGYDCGDCIDNGNDTDRNCDGSGRRRFRIVTELGGSFNRCPKSWLRDDAEDVGEWLEDHRRLEKYNVMPTNSGTDDLDYEWLDAMDTIDREVERLRQWAEHNTT